MATEADIPVPVFEARGEQVGNFVNNIVKISVSEVPLEKQNQDGKHNELPIVEGENFLKSPLTDEVHCEANNVAPDVSKVVEKTSADESQQNAEESDSKDGDEGVVPEKCNMGSSVAITPELKVADTIDDPHTVDTTGVTQLSKEMSSDHHGAYDSSAENVALTKEILLESSLPSEETESHTPCISEGVELNVQPKASDDKSVDEKPTEEDMPSNLTNQMTLEQEALENERSVEENLNTAAEKASHENSTSGETITTLETSDGDKLQNKSELSTSLSEEESQQNAEELNSKDEDGDRGVVPEQCSMDSSVVTSEMKVGDTTNDPCTDDAAGVTQLSKETSSDRHGTCDSSTENIALTKAILLESSHPSEEIGSHTPCIAEGEELNVQSKTIDDKSADEKPTEEGMSSNLTNEMTSEQEASEIERSVEDNFNTAAEKASHENSTPQETITPLESSNGDKLQSMSDFNTPLSEEEETAGQKGDKSVPTSEDHGVTSEKTLSESHGDVECQSKTLEDAATDHNDPKLAKKSEESSAVQVEDSQIERDEHFEEESEKLPLTEASTGGADDNVVPEIIDNMKSKDRELKEAELSENEQRTSTLVKEDVHNENPVESFYVAPENIEVSAVSQENSIKGPPEEQSRIVTLHEDTIKAEEATIKAEKATIDADDEQKEGLQSFPTIVSSSHEEGSMNAVLQEAMSDHTDGKIIYEVDNHKEVLENLSSGEGHCEVNNGSPDVSKDTEKTDQSVKDGSDTLVDRPVELAANEEPSDKEIQLNAEESNITDKDGCRDVVPEVCSTDLSVATSEIKVGDTLVDPNMDDAEVVTQLSKDTSSDSHGTNDSSNTNVALTEELLQETDIPSTETESHAPCISEGEEPNVQVKTADNKSVDEKPIEEDIPCNLTNEVSKEGESDHNKMTSEQEGLENERSVENSSFGETIITLETSNSDELQSKSDLNSSLSKEEEMAVQKSDEPVTMPEEYGVPSEKTSSESHGDVECQSKTLEDAATNHSNPKLAEKSEESSLVQVEDSQIAHSEHLEKESEGLPLTEVSTVGTNDNISAATDEVKDEVEDHKEAELSESEQSTKCTLVKEDVEIENPAEPLHVAIDNIEVSNASQENNIEVLPEDQSTNTNLHGNTIEAEEATIDAAEGQKDSHESLPPIVSGSSGEGSMNAVIQAVTSDYTDDKISDEVDKHKEVSENLSTTVSTEDAEGNSSIKLEDSEDKKKDDSGKESEETLWPLPLAREVSDAPIFSHEAGFEDEEPKKAEFCDDERDTESMLQKTESRTENAEDVHVNPEDTKAPDSVDKRLEGETVDAAAEKEETVENVPTIVPSEKTEENSFIQVDGQETENEEHLDKENEQLSLIKDYTVNANYDEVIVKDEDKTEDEEPSGAELCEEDKDTECVFLKEEVQSEKPVESFHAALEDIKTSDHTEATGILEEKIPTENSQGIPSDETEETGIDAANTIEKTQELQNDNDLLIKVAASEMTHDINMEDEPERPSLTETSKEVASDNESILLEPKTSDEYPSKVELPKDEKSTDCNTPKKESLQPEEQSLETTCSLEEQSLEENSQTLISNKIADQKDLALENIATETPHEHIQENSVTQVDCSAREHEGRSEEDNQNSSLIEAPTEETNARESKNIEEHKNRGEESITPEVEYEEDTESTYVKEETDVDNPIDSLPVKPEDAKQHDSCPDINNSIKEEISSTDPVEISTDKAERESIDTVHTNEESVETKDVAKDIPDCDKEVSIPIEEVGSKHPLNEASAGNTNDEESTKITEGCLIRNEEPLDSLQVAAQDTETPPLSQDRETSSQDEESPTTNPEAIMDDNKEELPNNATGEVDETPENKDIEKDISDCGKEDNMPTEEVGSQKPLNEASAGNANDEESTKITEGCLIMKEEPTESLHVAAQDTETPPLSQDREPSSLDEESPTTNPEAIMDDNKEEIPDNATGEVDETPENKDIGKDISDCGKEDNMPTEVVGSQKPLNEASAGNANDEESTKITEGCLITKEEPLESLQVATQDPETSPLSREREISSPDEQSPIANPEGIRDDNKEEIADSETGLEGETPKDKQNIVHTSPYEDKEESMGVQEDCSQQEQTESENIPFSEVPAVSSTESSPVKEEEKVEIPTEEHILTADPQETCDETQEKTVDAANKNNDVVMSVPNEDSEDNSPIEVDGLQEPSSEEVPAEKINDDESTTTHEAEFAYENTVKDNLNEDEEKIECALVKEEVHFEPLQAADEDIKDTSSGQDREASHLEEQAPSTDPHGIMGDKKYAKTLGSTDLKEETLEDKNYAATPDEDPKEDSRNQVDGLLLDQEEHLVKDSESTSLSDAPKDDITESTLVKEIAHVEDPIDSSQVATEDIKAFAPCQDTERSSTAEQSVDREDVSSNKITEKIVDATGEETQEAQDVAKSVPEEDDSPNEQDTEATLIKEDVSTELPQIAAEDREEPCLGEVRETNSQEEQILCASPAVRINDNEENKTTDPTIFENETPKDEVPKEVEGETKKEEGHVKDVQMTTAVTIASNQEMSLNLTAEETPCADDLNVNKDIIGDIPEVSNYKQQDSPVMKVSEEHMLTSSAPELESTSMESEVSENISDQVVGEANNCGDKTDLEKIEVLNDGSAAVPTSETLAETDPKGCTETEVQVPNGEKEAEVFKREAENDQMNINKKLPYYAASEDVLVSKEVNGEEEIDSNNCKEISSSPISVASQEVSTSNVALEEDLTSNSVTDLETKNEEEDPAIKETTPSSAEGQGAESISVEENSNYAGSLTEEKSDSNEVAPGENKSGYESNNRGPESIAQGQSFDTISKTEENKTEEEDLKAEEEIQSDKAVTEDISQEETTCEKEIVKDDISSEKEQLPRIKEEHEDIKDYHQGSCEEEVITDSHQEDEVKQDQYIISRETYEFTKNGNDTETVSDVSKEADDKAPEDQEEKIVTNEAMDRILHQEEEQATSIEEPTTKIDHENARELDIACVNTGTQESYKEAVQIAIIPGRESEAQNKEDEICSSDEVRVKDEENLILSEGKSKEEAEETYKEAYVEAEKFDLSSQTKDISECAISDVGQEILEDNENSTTKKLSEEDYPKQITECKVSTAGIALTEQPSEDAFTTAEAQEAKAGIDLGAAVPVPEATGLESQEVEELNVKCTEMAGSSTPVETPVISTSENIGESTEGTPLEAEDQKNSHHDLPEESNMRDAEVKTEEKDDTVNLQSVRDIQDQESCKESFQVSNNHNPVEGDPEERIETCDGQETKPIQNASVSEILKQEIEEQKLGRDSVDVHEEEKNIDNIPNQLESVYGEDTEKVSESSIHQSSVEDTAHHDKKVGDQQIDSSLFLPHAQCSDIKTSENEPAHVGGLGSADVTELEASPLSLKDKHVVLEPDYTRNLIPDNLDGDKNVSAEHSQGERDVAKPSKVEQEDEECRNAERAGQEMEGKLKSEETSKPSLSDLLQVSTRGTSEMADHSPTEKEPTSHTEDMHAENIDEAEHENMKTDEERDDEEESHEQKKSDLGSEAPVMVDIGDADMKVTHKKSHNILSGVGSKVKHSIAKVKKAITGKSPSPKKATNPESK